MTASTHDPSDTAALLRRARDGDPDGALADMFSQYRDRLRRMIDIRMDRRLLGRLDPSDVLQDAYLEASSSFPEYLRRPDAPFYLWLRCIAGRKLMSLHRYHLGAKARDARREVALYRGAIPEATSEAIAAQLLGQLTSPSEAAIRAERRIKLQEALNRMESIDREVLVLRHFEQLSGIETAQILDIDTSAASKRHVRALARLRDILKDI